MSPIYRILTMGASYGSLLAAKLLPAGHQVTLICLPRQAELINREGIRVRIPARAHGELVDIDSRTLRGTLLAADPYAVKPTGYDLVVLAMMEPQYRSQGVRELLDAIARERVPCLSIMNMPPLPYLKRIPGLNADACRDAYADATVWDSFDPKCVTLCSPDPQAFRPVGEAPNTLQVGLPTNFKAARFDSDAHTAILRQLEADIEAARYEVGGNMMELPVKLRVHDSIFVPLAKWPMLVAGNYRCITKDGARSIKDTVHSDLDASRAAYNWVVELCVALGAAETDLVPFEKYAKAAESLVNPSSAARALFAGATDIERVDRLVQIVATQFAMQSAVVDGTVTLVDARLEANRRAAAT